MSIPLLEESLHTGLYHRLGHLATGRTPPRQWQG
jgi:hypothetical protein